jgi:hypothetical protein
MLAEGGGEGATTERRGRTQALCLPQREEVAILGQGERAIEPLTPARHPLLGGSSWWW